MFIKKIFKFILRFLRKERVWYRFTLPFILALSEDDKEKALREAFNITNTTIKEGDYLEFGVYQGRTFHLAYNIHKHTKRSRPMHFYAFDSFQGLPSDEGVFSRGQYACNESDFKQNIQSHGVDLKDVTIVAGWYKEILNNELKLPIKQASVILIDCDIYESVVPVLSFITKHLTDGTVIIFDDWFLGRGIQKAFEEWIENNPNIKAIRWLSISLTQSFILEVKKL